MQALGVDLSAGLVPKGAPPIDLSAGLVPHDDSTKTTPSFWSDPRAFLQQRSTELAGEAQHQTDLAMGPESQGKPFIERLGHRMLSLAPETAAAVDKITGGLMDWRNVPIAAATAIDPALGASLMATQGTGALTGITPGVQPGNTSPENVQNALMQGSMVAGAGAGVEAPNTGRAVAVARNLPETARNLAQESLNIGPRQTATALVPYQKELAKINASNSAVQAEHAQATEDLNARFNERAQQIQELQQSKIAGWRGKVDEINAKNAADLAQWKETTNSVNAINQARREAVGQRAQLASDIGQNGTVLATRLKDLESTVRKVGSDQYEAVAKQVGDDVADSARIRNAVAAGRSKISGSPESIKLFDNILNDTQAQSVETSMGTLSPEHPLYQQLQQAGAIEGTPGIGFRDLQGYYSELGRKIWQSDLPGDVTTALKTVRKSIGDELGTMADRHGAGDAYSQARTWWKGYEDTFHDMSPVSQGGSPVARAFRAVDPDYAVAPFTGPAGLRAINMVGKYDGELAQVARETAAKYRQMQSLPKVAREQALPAQPSLTPTPPPPLVPHGPQAAGPAPLPPPELQAHPMFDPRDAKMEILNKIAEKARGEQGWGLFSDIAALVGSGYEALRGNLRGAAGALAFPVTRRLAGRALESPSLGEWLTRPNAAEVRAGQVARTPARMAQVQGIMDDAKNGVISPGEADRRIKLLGGDTKVKRPSAPPR